MSRSNTVAQRKPAELLEGCVRGFCTTPAGKADLLAFGLTEKQIHGERLDRCRITYRGRPGWIVLAEDMRAFGESKAAVAAQCAGLEKAKIRILDISHPEHDTYSQHQQFAHQKIAGARLQDKRAAKRVGRLGGIGKGAASMARRSLEMADKYIGRIVNHPAISWAVKAELLDGIGSISTLRRHFYNRKF